MDEGLPSAEGHGELRKGAGPEQGALSGGLSFLSKAVESPEGLVKLGSDMVTFGMSVSLWFKTLSPVRLH